MKFVIAGASGAVGREVLRHAYLLDEGSQEPQKIEIIILARHPIDPIQTFGIQNFDTRVELWWKSRVKINIVKFDELLESVQHLINTDTGAVKDVMLAPTKFVNHFRGADCVISCLGTTMAKSGTEGLTKVDFLYQAAIAILARRSEVPRFILCSAQNASATSYFHYPKVKALAENAITSCAFQNGTYIYRPGLIICERQERRVAESLLQMALKHTDIKNLASVNASDIAVSMLIKATEDATTTTTATTPTTATPPGLEISSPGVYYLGSQDIVKALPIFLEKLRPAVRQSVAAGKPKASTRDLFLTENFKTVAKALRGEA